MTVEEYLAYVSDYQRRMYDATVQARIGLVEQVCEDEGDLDALYDDEDPFTIWDEPFLLQLPEHRVC